MSSASGASPALSGSGTALGVVCGLSSSDDVWFELVALAAVSARPPLDGRMVRKPVPIFQPAL